MASRGCSTPPSSCSAGVRSSRLVIPQSLLPRMWLNFASACATSEASAFAATTKSPSAGYAPRLTTATTRPPSFWLCCWRTAGACPAMMQRPLNCTEEVRREGFRRRSSASACVVSTAWVSQRITRALWCGCAKPPITDIHRRCIIWDTTATSTVSVSAPTSRKPCVVSRRALRRDISSRGRNWRGCTWRAWALRRTSPRAFISSISVQILAMQKPISSSANIICMSPAQTTLLALGNTLPRATVWGTSMRAARPCCLRSPVTCRLTGSSKARSAATRRPSWSSDCGT
mmetsp:Transcript_14629/g.37376  ORF Transcript_14629/g.37376 Transcript_14629/m.37376 type:complete len:288 (-) Transcript_14629:1444-2307(-)